MPQHVLGSVLQRGLDPEDKAAGVMNYVEDMRRELRLDAHSCGAAEPRRLSREMCHIVIGPGRSDPLSELYPAVGSS